MTVTVLGSGTSSGVPVVACGCDVCRSIDRYNNRLRSSIVLRGGGKTILVDCGADFRQQALEHEIDRLDAVLLTHTHSDHVGGIDEIRLYNWKQGGPIPLYGSAESLADLRKRFDYIFNPLQEGGGIPQLELETIDGSFRVSEIEVQPIDAMHGNLPVLGFRFGDFGYVTDASHIPDESIRRLGGVRYLIVNALRHRKHPTHMNIEQATEVAQRIGAERTWFTHITHDLDHKKTNAELPENIQLAHDGLEFEIDTSAEMPR